MKYEELKIKICAPPALEAIKDWKEADLDSIWDKCEAKLQDVKHGM